MITTTPEQSFWAVSEEDGGFLITLARYSKIGEFVWFVRIEGDKRSCISFFPYVSTFNLSLEIRSNNAFPVTKDIEETALGLFPKSIPLSTFESGPIVGFFPYEERKELVNCIRQVTDGIEKIPLKEKARWAIYTDKMIRWIRKGIPVIRILKTPREVLGL